MSSRAVCTLALLTLVFAACGTKEETGPAEKEPAKSEAAAETGEEEKAEPEAPDAEGGTGEAAGTTGGEEAEPANDPQTAEIEAVGVAACDEYIAAFTECVKTKAPEVEREAHLRTLGEQVHAWKQTKEGAPNADKALEIGCKGARAAAAEAASSWGCEI